MGEFLTYYLPVALLWIAPFVGLLALGIWEDKLRDRP